ncbi:rhodanese-like domain-containing protein [Methanosarcina sp. KYL-1]|uniref:rhodanese-like domain-containing protein n=1 Tax=Methanosarcina sp. KYL-1 TaxID=2602068 RepID=UPI002100F626|nr:rhodanese-like domain-containing protein [Methanosarcina sp. KYL-1]MCQ1536077.1 rhodanese-like domain-containing protein [Methanosarcina sp. KYL-1]
MNKQNLTYIALFFLLLIAVLIFTSQPEASPPGFETVSVDEARGMIEKGDLFLLDVRTPAEFDESHLEGAVLIPLENGYGSNLGPDQLLEARINEVPKGKKVLVYCRTGRRSAVASQMLVDAGYTDVYNMGGGINEWTAAGYPVVTGP